MIKDVLLTKQAKSYLLLALCLLSHSLGWSQSQLDIIGVVRDVESQEPIPRVTVTIDSSGFSVKTDIDGKLQLQARGDVVLVFRHMGYEEQYVYVDNRAVINVSLEKSSVGLDEV